jgi:hypothetical protein
MCSLWKIVGNNDLFCLESLKFEEFVNWLELVEIKRSSFEISEVEGMITLPLDSFSGYSSCTSITAV